MANPTTNYGWPMPTATDLVTDLPADFAAFGQPVDTSLKALNPETTLGDISYRSATANTNTRLPIGTSGQVLAVSGGGVPAWTTTADVTPLTTKGDLFTFTTVDARIGVGADGTVLTADSAEATGLKWAASSSAIKQIVTATHSTTVSATGTTKVDTGLTATITPSSASSKILVFVGIPGFIFNTTKTDGYAEGDAYVLRGATVKQYGWNYLYNIFANTAGTREFGGSLAFNYVDSPATTSATTYKVQINSDSASTTTSTNAGSGTGPISMILMEI